MSGSIMLFGIALVFTGLTVYSIRRYVKKHTVIKELVDRCIECKAEVIDPTVLRNKFSEGNLYEDSPLLSEFQTASNIPLEYACTEVKFNVNDETIQTMALRQVSSMKNPKPGELITIYYDPYDPKQAFAKDMKGILLRKPLRDCFIYGAVAIISFLSAIFLQLV